MRLSGLSHDSVQTLILPAFGRPTTGPGATIRIYVCGSWTVFETAGELGWTATRGLRDLVRATPAVNLVFDLGHVTCLDHNSLAVLAHAHRTKRSLGGAVRLVEPPQSTRTLLRLCHAFDLPPVFPSVDEAVS